MNGDAELLQEYLLRMLLMGEVFSYDEGVSGERSSDQFDRGIAEGYIVTTGLHQTAKHMGGAAMGAYKVTQKGLNFIKRDTS